MTYEHHQAIIDTLQYSQLLVVNLPEFTVDRHRGWLMLMLMLSC